MSMEDLLKGILGGAQRASPDQGSQADPLSDLLGGILGGIRPKQAGGGAAGAGGLQDVLGGILGGADGKLDGGDIAGILGGILGGGGGGRSTQPSSGGLGDILGGILGGAGSGSAAQPSPGGLGGILGGILRGGSLGANSFLAPIITELAERIGIPPAMASAVVSFLLGKLLSRPAGGAEISPGRQQPSRRGATQAEGLDLDHLLDTLGTGQQPSSSYLRSTGIVDELSQQTGLDKDTALDSLKEVLGMLGTQLSAARAPRGQAPASDLDHLLDSWQD